MPGVTATLALSLVARLTGAAVSGESPIFNASIDRSLAFTPGTDAVTKADILYKADRTLVASATEDLDLAGVLATALGVTIAAAEICAIIIEAAAGNTNDVVFGPTAAVGALGPFSDITDRLKVAPGDFHVLTCKRGWTITAATADKMTFTNGAGGTPVTYTLTLIGRTVAA